MSSLADHGSLLQGTNRATYRGVSNLEDWDMYYPYFESEAEALLVSDTTAGRTAALPLKDSLLPSLYISQQLSTFPNPGACADFAGYPSTENQHYEPAYLPGTHRFLEQEAGIILPRSTLPSSSNHNNVDWSDVGSKSSSLKERIDGYNGIAEVSISFDTPPKIHVYKCLYLGCDFESQSQRGPAGHKSVHATGIFPCPKCDVVFFRSKALSMLSGAYKGAQESQQYMQKANAKAFLPSLRKEVCA
ncbi:hypothetical protein EDD18DRAFT_1358748 [Armillaria luteobubalina]|uniref:Uncharacterized protein n=1 Tax=Armillaria luteobubalina TaxID=153913 RepID=A0AA39PT87_9AGAR|nr:hypothetical protein EDD18DRAFT_1358748 [Armillaria luteobubalina]